MIHLHDNDLPDNLDLGTIVAIDTETMGLLPHRDRLCLIQLSAGDGSAHLVRFTDRHYDAPNLKKLLENPQIQKLFHFARFDVACLQHWLGVMTTSIWCTKIASRLCRTYTDRHGLKDLCRELLGVELQKQQQSSDWGNLELSHEQLQYAASDVLYLHQLQQKLAPMLEREGRTALAQACFEFLPHRARLDLAGWAETDIFSH